jgi:heme exporter protein B
LPNGASSSVAAIWAVFRKECRSEWRTRFGLSAALLFSVTTLAAVSFAVGRMTDRTDLLAALLWIVLLFAALTALSHSFVHEVEGHTLTLLRLVAPPLAIALGKTLFHFVFLAVLELVTVPLFFILMAAPAPHWGPFLALLGLGSAALAVSTTLVGALIAQSRGRGALFAALSLPLLLPVLAVAVSGTKSQWAGGSIGPQAKMLVSYTLALLAVSLVLYDHLWEE